MSIIHRPRTGVVLLGAVLAAAALASCASGDATGAQDDGSASAPGSPTEVTYATGWVSTDFQDLPVVVAQERGHYAEQGLEVVIRNPPSTTTSPKLVATGDADIGGVDTANLVAAVQQEGPLTAISLVWTQQANCLVAPPGEEIDPADFAGRTFAIFAGPEPQAVLDFFLEEAGLTQEDVTVVTADSDNIELVLAGRADYAINAKPYAIAQVVSATGEQPEILLMSDLGGPDYPQTGYAGNVDWLEENPEVARGWLTATQQAFDWAQENPEEAVDLFVEAVGEDVAGSTEYNLAGWQGVLDLTDGAFEPMTDEQWTALEESLRTRGALTGSVDISTLFTNDYLPGT
jgi:putative hydroxymethylpyrimidine transport system substrate-binding protein